MRVTQQMLMARTASDLSGAMTRLLDLQSSLSSGKRLRRPSDDPTGIPRSLSYRTSIAAIAQYRKNGSYAESHLATIEQSLSSASGFLVRARELATSLGNDDFDAAARAAAATEVQSLIDQLMQTGNAQKEGRYLFSGHKTRTTALLATANGVVYQGDQGIIYSEIESSSKVAVNLVGSDVFMASLGTLGEGFDLNRGLETATLLADLRQGAGISITGGSDISITDVNSNTTVVVDLTGATTVNDVLTAINTQLAAGGIANFTASISPTGTSLRFDATQGTQVSTLTKIADLNNGQGIDMSPGTMHVTNDAATVDVTVDLTGSATVGDMISAFNTQMAAAAVTYSIPALANVTMALNAAQDGVRIIDGNGTPYGLRVEDPAGGTTALGLGLVGYVNAELDGGPLSPTREVIVAEGGAGQTTAQELGILGTFIGLKDGTDLDPILTQATPISQLNSSSGMALGRIRIAQGSAAAIVDLSSAVTISDVISTINASGLALTASINAAGTGIQVVPTDTTRSLIITNQDSGGGAKALGIEGSPDMMGSLMLLAQSLQNNDRDMVSNLIGRMEKANDVLLDRRAAVGARVRRLQTTMDRLQDVDLLVTRLLSEVEDADIVKVTTELATQQNIYQAALNAVARALNPSLADFVR